MFRKFISLGILICSVLFCSGLVWSGPVWSGLAFKDRYRMRCYVHPGDFMVIEFGIVTSKL